jgi:hypothetical protein
MGRQNDGFGHPLAGELKSMAEETFGSTVLAGIEGASSIPASHSRPAIKSRPVANAWDNGRPTSEATSLGPPLAFRRSDGGEPDRETPGPAKATASYKDFRRICDDLFAEAKRAQIYLLDGKLSDTGMEVVVEVEELLDRLYANAWGQDESLKRIVVAIGSQLNNVDWTDAHVGFLKNVVSLLRNSYLIDDSLVTECLELIREHGLEVFRGTVTETEVRKKYRIAEVE